MNWLDTPVLVTGAGGFIGSHLVERLAREGAKVRAFVRYTSRGDAGFLDGLSPDLRSRVEIVHGDLRDESAVLKAMEDIDTVFHLGALIAIPYSYRHPREVVDTNVTGTLNVLEAARRTTPRRIVQTSTSEVYGTARTVPIAETHPLQGQSPYAASKIAADRICESYYRAFDVPVTILRPFNTFGPRQSTRAVIPTIMTQALTQDVIRLGALWPTRDFTYVADTVSGFLCAAIAPDVEGMDINLGTGREITIGDLVKAILPLAGCPEKAVEVEDKRMRPPKSEVGQLLSDNSLARDKLQWSPVVSLEDGLAETLEWVRGNMNLLASGGYSV